MKKLIGVVTLSLLSFASFAGTDPLEFVGDRCAPGDVLFYGQTANHKKEVLVCQWGTNIFYQFGKLGHEPELSLKLDVSQVTELITDNQTTSSEYLVVPNGNMVYQIGQSSDLPSAYTYGIVKVIKQGKGELAEIMLDPDTVVNGIRSNFVKQGL